MRIFLIDSLGHCDTDLVQHLDTALLRALARCAGVIYKYDLVKLISDREDRIKARHRLLKDHRDLSAADLSHIGDRHFRDIKDLFFGLEHRKSVTTDLLNGDLRCFTMLIGHILCNDLFFAVLIDFGLVNGDRLTRFIEHNVRCSEPY